jgi:hypothetical protein
MAARARRKQGAHHGPAQGTGAPGDHHAAIAEIHLVSPSGLAGRTAFSMLQRLFAILVIPRTSDVFLKRYHPLQRQWVNAKPNF